MSRAATCEANNGIDGGVNPRTCALPREVISKIPLACARAAKQSAMKALGEIQSFNKMRTRRPSPVGMGSDSPGQAPRRNDLFMPLPPLSAPRDRRQYHCGADAT